MNLIEKYPVELYNTLSRKKELFKPITEGHVGIYLCGPTVYSDPHLGHARGAIGFDVMNRYFQYLGYKVRFVRNVTDVGHLEDEVQGAGEDRITKKAKVEKLEPMEIAQKYINSYRKYIGILNILEPSIEPAASGHIIEQINVIKNILEHGFAYETNGSIYFDVLKYMESGKRYGELSGKVIEDLMSSGRELEGQDEKKNPVDFALWKKAKPEHIMKWDSPWGEGFPGWHLECTAMSAKYLGVPFDIHCGGMDLQFPHHESEIAQCNGAFGKSPVNYWVHNNMLTINGQKMARSLGNFITLEELFAGKHEKLEQAYSPMTVRFFTLQTHYRTPIDFSNEALQAAEKGLIRLMNSFDVLNSLVYQKPKEINADLEKEINELIESLFISLSDDSNTPKTLAALFDLSKHINSFKDGKIDLGSISKETFEKLHKYFNDFVTVVLGLQKEQSGQNDKLDGVMNLVLDIRKQARENKDWPLSDKIRDDLAKVGIQVKDGKDGSTYSIN